MASTSNSRLRNEDSGRGAQTKRPGVADNSPGENISGSFEEGLLDTPESCGIVPQNVTTEIEERCRKCGKRFSYFPHPSYTADFRWVCADCDRILGKELAVHDPLYGKINYPWKFVFDKGTQVVKGILLMPPEVFEPVKHAQYSPSTYGAREACKGWAQDKDTSTVGAAMGDRGTAIHKAIEKENTSKLHDEGDIACAKKCIGFLRSRVARLKVPRHYRELLVEVLDQFGYVDDLLISGDYAEMTDYKTGWRPVTDAEENPQMQGYALGIFDKFPEVEILQVNLLMPRQDEISEAVYTRSADYQRLKDRTFATIEGAKATDRLFDSKSWEQLMKILHPSASNCEFCGRKAICPALNSLALTVAKRYDPELLIPAHLHGSNITNPEMMSTALMIAPVLEKWSSGIRKAAIDMRVKEGKEIPGFELGERRGVRKISNAQAAWDVVKEKISPEEFAGCADVSLTDLEKAVAAKAPRGEKTAAKLHLEDALRDRDAIEDGAPSHYLKQNRIVKAIEVK